MCVLQLQKNKIPHCIIGYISPEQDEYLTFTPMYLCWVTCNKIKTVDRSNLNMKNIKKTENLE